MIDENSGIWLTPEHKHWFDQPLAESICTFLKEENPTVCDIGCGEGKYVRYLRDAGIDCIGFDGSPHTPILSHGYGRILDVSIPIKIEKYDWIISLEVGEHIPKQREEIFINNICTHARAGIILSWAIPGQGGEGHFNEQPNEYIKCIMQENGYINSIDIEQLFRKNSTLSWFKNTLMVFRRKEL